MGPGRDSGHVGKARPGSQAPRKKKKKKEENNKKKNKPHDTTAPAERTR